jgi:hypothetical protein
MNKFFLTEYDSVPEEPPTRGPRRGKPVALALIILVAFVLSGGTVVYAGSRLIAKCIGG